MAVRPCPLPRWTGPRGPRPGWSPGSPARALLVQFSRFTGVGTAATGLQLLLYTGLRLVWGPLSANLLAMLVSTLAGIELNRRLTFGARGRARLLRQYAGSVAVFLVGLALSSAGLALITELDPGAARRTELLTLLTVAVLVGLIRFFLLREWVFPRREPVNE